MDGNWSSAGNWSSVPIAADTPLFAGTANTSVNNDAASSTAGMRPSPAGRGPLRSAAADFTLTAGILNLSTSNQTINLPMAVAPSSGGITLSAQAGPLTTTVLGTIDNGGTTLTIAATANVTLGGAVSGSGGLSKTGPGLLTLTASNLYSGGTTISAGTLTVGSGASGWISGGVTTNALLAFNRSDNVTFGGVISGSGGLAQNGGGILLLTGSNTYQGGTTINNGTLRVSLVGQVVPSGTALSTPSITSAAGRSTTTAPWPAKYATFNTSYGTVSADPTAPSGSCLITSSAAGTLRVNLTTINGAGGARPQRRQLDRLALVQERGSEWGRLPHHFPFQ